MSEIWKPVVGFEGIYEVSSHGRVKRISKEGGSQINLVLKHHQIKGGYHSVILSWKNIRKNLLVSRLVATAFLGHPKNGQEANHKDGDVTNNYSYNLEWLSRSDNILHAYRVLNRKPSRGNTKLYGGDVAMIRQLLASGNYTQNEIGKMYNVGRSAIYDIKAGNTWNHI